MISRLEVMPFTQQIVLCMAETATRHRSSGPSGLMSDMCYSWVLTNSAALNFHSQ